MGPFDSPPMGSDWLPINMVGVLPFSCYLSGSKHISARPIQPDTMTITALQATTVRRTAKMGQFCQAAEAGRGCATSLTM